MELIRTMANLKRIEMDSLHVTDAGRPPRVTDEELMDVFRESDDPALIASEVADHVPIGRRGVYQRLEQLAEDGALEYKKIGGRGTIWWLSSDESGR